MQFLFFRITSYNVCYTKLLRNLIYHGMLQKDVQKIHRIVNLNEIWQTPGLINKLKLAHYEFFPAKDYMLQWGGGVEKRLWRLYCKRLFRI